jgi:hypothetical protein
MVQQLIQSTKTLESTSCNVWTAVLSTLDRLEKNSKLGMEGTYCHTKMGIVSRPLPKNLIKNDHNMGKIEDMIKVV